MTPSAKGDKGWHHKDFVPVVLGFASLSFDLNALTETLW